MTWQSGGKPRKNSRAKGARAEIEIAAILRQTMARVETEVAISHGIEAKHSEDVRRTAKPMFSQGEDLAGVPELCAEVKHVEANETDKHWEQCLRQAKLKPGRFPVLFYKKNRRGWRVRSYASLQNPDRSEVMRWIVADYNLDEFLAWYAEIYRALLIP